MKLILHIGTEKTGSTSIQESLFGNRELLLSQGYALLSSLGVYTNRDIARYSMRLSRDDGRFSSNERKTHLRKAFKKFRIKKAFEKELNALPESTHTVIISSEFLHSRLHYSDELVTLKTLLSHAFSEIHILCYLRPQIDLAVSFYSTALKDGYVQNDIDAFINEYCVAENPYYNYDALLARYEEAFSIQNITPILFDRDRFHQNDLVLDFYNHIDPSLARIMRKEGNTFIPSNESVTILGQELINLLNQKAPNRKKPRYRRIISLISEHLKGKGKMPTRDTAKKVQKRFDALNQSVAERYFPEQKTLFEIDYEKFPTAPAVISQTEQRFFEEMLELCLTSR